MTRLLRRTAFGAIAFAALLAAAIAPVTASAQAFEGVITMRVAAAAQNGQPTPSMEYLVRKGRVRMNIAGPMGGMSMIAVPDEKKVYMLVDAQRIYAEMPTEMQGRAGAAADQSKLIRTGKRETIAGYSCEHMVISGGRDSADVCITRGIGTFVTAPVSATAMPAWQRQLIAQGAFPLRVSKLDGTTLLEVTKIEKKTLRASMFEVPDSYTKMEMPTRPPGDAAARR